MVAGARVAREDLQNTTFDPVWLDRGVLRMPHTHIRPRSTAGGSVGVLCRSADPAGYAVAIAAASPSPSSSIAVSRILNFCTLPVTVIGNESTNLT